MAQILEVVVHLFHPALRKQWHQVANRSAAVGVADPLAALAARLRPIAGIAALGGLSVRRPLATVGAGQGAARQTASYATKTVVEVLRRTRLDSAK